MNSILSLLQVGLQWEEIDVLDEMIEDLFCVRNVTLERLGDEFLTDTIKVILNRGKMDTILSQFHTLYYNER